MGKHDLVITVTDMRGQVLETHAFNTNARWRDNHEAWRRGIYADVLSRRDVASIYIFSRFPEQARERPLLFSKGSPTRTRVQPWSSQ